MLVIPPMNKVQPAIARKMRNKTMLEFNRVLLSNSKRGRSNNEEEKEYVAHQLAWRAFKKGGKKYHEFYMKVESYAERDSLKHHLPVIILKNYMESEGIALCVSLIGHSRTNFILLKYCMLPILGSECSTPR